MFLQLQQKYLMFPTQIPVNNQCRTRPTTAASSADRYQNLIMSQFNFLAQNKLRQVKQRARTIQKQYEGMLSNVNKLKKTIKMTRGKACQKVVQINKSFQVKKLKLNQFQLQEQKRSLSIADRKNRKKLASEILQSQKFFLTHLKYSQLKTSHELREKNKTEKIFRKSQIYANRIMNQTQAKLKYEKIKQQEYNLANKKKRIADLSQIRAKINYQMKVQQEKDLINSYDEILREFQHFTESQEPPISTVDQSATIFLTKQRQV